MRAVLPFNHLNKAGEKIDVILLIDRLVIPGHLPAQFKNSIHALLKRARFIARNRTNSTSKRLSHGKIY